jgi:hydroxymethylbilane synthase
MRLKLASRKSDLARWQAVSVAHALESIDEKPGIEFIFKSSFGDQNLDIPLAGMGARGVFTEDFYKDLTDGRCDLVVHSWKDLPIEDRADTRIAMTMERADVRDVLLIPEEVWQKALQSKSLAVMTSSPRRVYNLSAALPKLLPGGLKIEFRNVRGNVPTRLKKMRDEGAALVLAKAGLDRLLEAEAEGFIPSGESVRALIHDCRFQVLPVSLNPPAPAQGALAVEIARANETLSEICARLTDEVTFKCVQMEREILNRYGGGCHQKIGVARLPRDYGLVCALRGLTEAGEVLEEWRVENATPWTKARAKENIFPLNAKDNSWFEREALPPKRIPENFSALLVARADAWPENLKAKEDRLVWAAGVQTWMKLAERGIFVSGCQDGLGEAEEKKLDVLAGPLHWCKLTHDEAAEGHHAVATYALRPKAKRPDLKGKTHFFWMSRTSFEEAWAHFPNEIAAGHNACGPGHTWEFLKTFPGLKNPVKVVMGLGQFLHETLP